MNQSVNNLGLRVKRTLQNWMTHNSRNSFRATHRSFWMRPTANSIVAHDYGLV